MRKHALQNFHQKGYYLHEHDLFLQTPDLDGSMAQIKIMREAKNIKSKF